MRVIMVLALWLMLSGCGLFMERPVEQPGNYDWVQNMSEDQFRAMMADFNQTQMLHELQFQSQIQMMPVWVDVWK